MNLGISIDYDIAREMCRPSIIRGRMIWNHADIQGDVLDDSLKCSKIKIAPVWEFIDLAFDDHDVLLTKDFLTIKSGTCTNTGVCYHWTKSLLTVFAPTGEDAEAKRFQANPDQCAVYVYSVDSFNAIDISSDGVGLHGRYWSSNGFVRIDLIPGSRTVSAAYSALLGSFSRAISLDCSPEHTYFLREQNDVEDNFSFRLVTSQEGQSEISKRNLITLADDA